MIEYQRFCAGPKKCYKLIGSDEKYKIILTYDSTVLDQFEQIEWNNHDKLTALVMDLRDTTKTSGV